MTALRTLIFAGLLGIAGARPVAAEVVVVVAAGSGIEALSQDQVINVFLGRYRTLPGGIAAAPIDQPVGDGLRAEFYRRLTNKGLAEINAYWARLFFSGKTAPPVQAVTPSDVVAHVLGVPGGIGYVERRQADARLRIVHEFPAHRGDAIEPR